MEGGRVPGGVSKAAEDRVLVIGMTNRLDMPWTRPLYGADGLITVGMPSEIEVHALLTAKVADIPTGATSTLQHVKA